MSSAPQRAGAFAYRPDIDGLRGLAVLAVIFYHAGVPGFGGGYVGVDVFFVISGYLITQFLRSTSARGARQILGNFYARRVRRIVPALLVTCAAVALVGWLLLMPVELVMLGKPLAAAPVFLSNLAAWSDGGGYFQLSYFASPLRHLWSIAVEEQFYLGYPLLLLAIDRCLPRRQVRIITVLALLSLLLCIWASHHRPAANYYALPTRAWELLLGALLALTAFASRSRVVNEITAAIGLTVLAATAWLYDPVRISYPGAYTLLPCTAAAALVAAGTGAGTTVNRLLAWPPLVFVGLISYSLYLWHLPLLTFAAYYSLTPLTAFGRAAVIACTLALAALSWRFIEQPVRQRVLLRSRRTLFLGAGTASALMLAAGLLLWNSDGFPQRLPEPEQALLGPPEVPGMTRCITLPPEMVRAGRVCTFGAAEARGASALLWGDSHALTVLPAFRELSARRHLALYFAATTACWPVLGGLDRTHEAGAQDRCAAFNAAVVDFVQKVKPQLVILGGHWNDQHFAAAPALEVADPRLAFTVAMRHTVQALRDAGAGAVCVVFDVPQLKYPGMHALLIAHRRGIRDDFLAVARADALAPVQQMEGDVRALAQASVLRFADPKAALCPGLTCLYKAGGRSLYVDQDHLSAAGAAYSAPALEACFEPSDRAR
jgi:peptidoglycan/LPS O-acetylase OafA/YrhL